MIADGPEREGAEAGTSEDGQRLEAAVAERTRVLVEANAALTRENVVLRAVADVAPGGYLDVELRSLFVSAATTGSAESARALVGRHIRDIMGEAQFADTEPYLSAALAGESARLERERPNRDGTLSHVLAQYTPHRVDGVVAGVVVHLIDITEAWRARRLIEEMNASLERRITERTEALQKSEDRFAGVFRSVPAALMVRRISDDRIIDVNDHFLEITGFTREDVIGRPVLETGLVKDVRTRREQLVREAEGSDSSLRDVEVPFFKKSGEERIGLASVERVELGSEGPCILSTFIDITERKLSEGRLGVQYGIGRVLAGTSSLQEAAPLLVQTICEGEGWDVGTVWEADSDTGLLRCAGGWHRQGDGEFAELVSFMRGLTFERGAGAIGRVWETARALVIDDIDAAADFLRREVAARAGLKRAVLFPILHGEEVVGVVDLLGRASTHDPRQEELLYAIGRQVGLFVARVRADATIRRSEKRLAAVIENLSEGLVIVGRDGRIQHFNPAAVTLHGLSSATDGLHPLAVLAEKFELRTVQGEPVPLSDWPVARILRGETVRELELEVRRIDVDWKRIFAYGGSLVEQEDGTTLAVVTINDITERMRRDELRRLSEKLAEDNREIREASRLKSEFLANMSHELRTPLNAIMGFSSLVHAGKAGPLTDSQREYLGDVLTSARHLLNLINDVLDLAKIESGHVELTISACDTAKLVAEVKDVLRELAAQKRLRVATEIDAGLGKLRVDERMAKQILYNLLSNAIKFTPDDGQVFIRVKHEDRRAVRLEVEDTGIGVRPEDMERLFVEFQQLDSSPGKRFQGTGLGLALTRKLAEAHGGHAGAESTHGKGSRFFVIIPREPPARNVSSRPPA